MYTFIYVPTYVLVVVLKNESDHNNTTRFQTITQHTYMYTSTTTTKNNLVYENNPIIFCNLHQTTRTNTRADACTGTTYKHSAHSRRVLAGIGVYGLYQMSEPSPCRHTHTHMLRHTHTHTLAYLRPCECSLVCAFARAHTHIHTHSHTVDINARCWRGALDETQSSK